jgi:hypothetical protein
MSTEITTQLTDEELAEFTNVWTALQHLITPRSAFEKEIEARSGVALSEWFTLCHRISNTYITSSPEAPEEDLDAAIASVSQDQDPVNDIMEAIEE